MGASAPPREVPVATPEQHAAAAFGEKNPKDKLVQELRDRNAKNPHDTLTTLAQRTKIAQRPIDELTANNIGTKIDSATGKKDRPSGSDEERRFKAAEGAMKRALTYFNEGYDALKKADPAGAEIIRGEVERVMRMDVGTNAYLDGVLAAGGNIESIIEGVLKNPKMQAKIREAVILATDPSKRLDAGNIAQLEEIDKVTQKDRTLRETEKASKQGEIDAILRNLDEFADGTTGMPQGQKNREMQALDKTRAADITEKRQKEAELTRIKDQIKLQESNIQIAFSTKNHEGRLSAQGEISRLNGQARKLEQEIIERGERIERRDTLEKTKGELENKKIQLRAEKDKIDAEFGKAEAAGLLAKTNLDQARLARGTQEEAYVDGLQNIFTEGTIQFVDTELAEYQAADQQRIREAIEQTGDPAEKAILKSIAERWEKEERSHKWIRGIKGTQMEINKEQANKDYEILMGSGVGKGPEAIMRDMLANATDAAGNKIFVNDPSGLTATEQIEAKLADAAFVGKMQPLVIERVLTARMQAGGKITEGEARIIYNKWGEQLIDTAIARKKGLRESINKLKAEGVFKGSVAQWLKEKSGGNILLVLFFLLASPMFGIGNVLKPE